jgi:TRAP-type C4-dicarboxylate transport system permease small subunit
MSEQASETARPTDPVGRALFHTARYLAIAGGLLCGLMAAMVTVSVTGRYLFAAPVPGDYDLVAIMAGTAVFAFLPYCQLVRGNVLVDFFTTNVAPTKKAIMDGFGTLLYLLVAVLFTWRLFYGMMELHSSGEVIAAFDFYRWWTVPFDIACMIVLILVILYTLIQDMSVVRGHMGSAPPSAGAG